jgi:hypothetical protein
MNEYQADLRKRFVSGPFDLTGAVDLHVHSAPCLFPRMGDDLQVATMARNEGMRAIALKSHHENTVSRAYHTEMAVEGIRIIGGIVMNQCTGGINPVAVETTLMMGGKIVWGPTGHSCYHGLVSGKFGVWGGPGMTLPGKENEAVTVLDPEGRLSGNIIEILDLVKKHDALFCTAHLSPDEIMKVVEYCRKIDAKVMVNHIYFFPRVGIDFAETIVKMGAYIELCSTLVIPSRHRKAYRYDYELLSETIKLVGAERCVMSTDAGLIVGSLYPHEQFRMFGERIQGYDISRQQVETMMCTNPSELVGL